MRVKLFKPDLIIAGAGLSEKSGLELCEAIKTDSEFKHIPFILLTGMFEEISEKDRARVGADGIISKPLREGEILSLVDHLFEEKVNGKVEREILKQEKGWTSLSEMEKPRPEEKEDFSLDGFDEENEEIIELVEVVEEPEPKMSIDDFITPAARQNPSEISLPWNPGISSLKRRRNPRRSRFRRKTFRGGLRFFARGREGDRTQS